MTTVTAGTSQTFQVARSGLIYTVQSNGGSIGQVTGKVNGKTISAFNLGPSSSCRSFGPFDSGDYITVTMQLGSANVQSTIKEQSSALTNASFISAFDYGVVPDTGADLSDQIEAVQQVARTLGVPVDYLPGKYIYKRKLNYLGGGVVCSGGVAWFDNQDPSYASVVWDFQSTDSSYLDGITIKGAKWTCSTRPDTGLSNGATENATFIRVTKARNVKVWENKFFHNHGGGILFRDVENSSIIGNEVFDCWKDGIHITDSSRNIVRAYNTVRANGDDAFAVVGYTSKGVFPVGIQDIGNRVHGVRKARGFAYVGCQGVENVGSYVDGRIPTETPQKTDGTGAYNTVCGLYIAAEPVVGSETYGCENIKVRGFVGEYIGYGKDAVGPTLGYNQIHIAANNGSGNPIKNIKIDAVLRNGTVRGLFTSGNGYLQDVDIDLTVEDNTDPSGLAGTAGAANANAVEFQGTRNIKLKLRGNKIGKGAVWIDAACTGFADIDVSVGQVCLNTAGQNVIHVVGTSNLDIADFKLNFESIPAASSSGSVGNLIYNPTSGITRSIRLTGVDHGTNANNFIWGANARTLTLGSSPTVIANVSGRQQLLQVIQGTVSAIARASIFGRAKANTVTTGAAGNVVVEGDLTDQYVNTKVVTFFNGRGVALGTGTCSGSTYAAATNLTTVNFAGSSVNASFAAGMQMGVLNTMKTVNGRTNGVIDLPAETAIQITYTVAPTTSIAEASY